MTTPRSRARTRRSAALLVLCAAGLLTLTGCDPRTLIYFLQPWEPSIPATGPSMKGKKVVVLTHVAQSTSDVITLDRDLTAKLVRILKEKVKKIDVVSTEKVEEWVEQHPSWTDPADVAKALEADAVIFLEVEQFETQNSNSPGLHSGVAKIHIQAFEWQHPKNSKGKEQKDEPKEAEKIYDEYLDTNFPSRGPIPAEEGVSRDAFKNKFVEVVATEVSWHFVEHAPGDDIQDVKFRRDR